MTLDSLYSNREHTYIQEKLTRKRETKTIGLVTENLNQVS